MMTVNSRSIIKVEDTNLLEKEKLTLVTFFPLFITFFSKKEKTYYFFSKH